MAVPRLLAADSLALAAWQRASGSCTGWLGINGSAWLKDLQVMY